MTDWQECSQDVRSLLCQTERIDIKRRTIFGTPLDIYAL